MDGELLQFPTSEEMESMIGYCMAREEGLNPSEVMQEEIVHGMEDFKAMEEDLSRQFWQRITALRTELDALSQNMDGLDPHEASRPQIGALDRAAAYLETRCEEVRQIIDRCIAEQRAQTEVNRTLNVRVNELQRAKRQSTTHSPVWDTVHEGNQRALARHTFGS
ncbi:MAG: hypothetical protein KDK40_03055 [Chlamydiia bacterium]|nr:hypothetical protein [Chlamydiia bacterium]